MVERVRILAPVFWLVVLGGCGSDGIGDIPTEPPEEPEQSVLTTTVDDPGGSVSLQPGTACGESVYPNPLTIPDSTADGVGAISRITNVATDHPLLSPNGDGHHDDTVFTADVFVDNPGDSPIRFVHWSVAVSSTETCTQVADLSGYEFVFYPSATQPVEKTIDFDSAPAGTIVSKQFPDVTFSCETPQASRPDECLLFDSENPTGGDTDLRTEDGGNVLIIAEDVVDADGDGLVDDPDDNGSGGSLTFDFEAPVELRRIGLLDIDENETEGSIVMTRDDGSVVTISIPNTGDGLPQMLQLGIPDVVTATINLQNSGAVTSITYAIGESGPAQEGRAMIKTVWDALNLSGEALPDGGYFFKVSATVEDENGQELDQLESGYLGMVIQSTPENYDSQPDLLTCDSTVDANQCTCAAGDGDCVYEELGNLVDFRDIEMPPPFVQSSFDTNTGRWTVIADVTQFNGAGLVPKSSGVWASEAQLRQFITDLTGVPQSSDARLLPFDYIQLGNTTGVFQNDFSPVNFNNLILDAITGPDGTITIAGDTTDLTMALNNPGSVPPEYEFLLPRQDDECTESANFDGETWASSKYCVYAEAIQLSSETGLGIYAFRSEAFDTSINGEGPTRELSCVTGTCGVRTIQSESTYTLDSYFYTQDGQVEAFVDQIVFTAPSVTRLVDRGPVGSVLSGQCSRSIATIGGDLRVRLDSADGAVGSACIINGVFE